jgi:SAM-dependent methyltransferase
MGCSGDVWGIGDYASWGDRFAEVGRSLVEEVGVAGLDVLDVGTGHGPTALAAALAGGRVTGLDATPELLAIARRRAAAAGVDVDWVEADMLAAPFPDRSFDRVLSTFGAMVAPDPRAAAVELVRLCRPGGVIASTAWTPDAVYSRIGGTLVGFLPADEPADEPETDPTGDEPAPSPADWADPDAVRAMFADLPVSVATSTRGVTVRWPSIDDLIGSLDRFGPLAGIVRELRATGAWPVARAALVELLVAEASSTRDELVVEVPYALTLATRRE